MELRTWDPSKVELPFSGLIIGSRRSGKSHAIKYLYTRYWADKFDTVCVMCATDINGQFYQSFIASKLFFTCFKSNVIESIQLCQRERVKNGDEMLDILIIIDDCSDSYEKFQSKLQEIYTKGRHYNISIVFSTQATQLTSPVWRNNSDIVMIGKQRGANARKLVTDNFLEGLSDDLVGSEEKKQNRELISKYTKDHGFLVLDFFNADDFSSTLYKWKAPAKI